MQDFITARRSEDFYPRPPRGGRHALVSCHTIPPNISIHALREEGDCHRSELCFILALFLSTPSARRATTCPRPTPTGCRNFYPRPPRGGRHLLYFLHTHQAAFLSTPSARRATRGCGISAASGSISIHALREEGDSSPPLGHRWSRISIHALREEGDPLLFFSRCCCFGYFYPRPPRGGRSPVSQVNMNHMDISIHALREEGDSFRGQK